MGENRVVIIGSGPAGAIAAWTLVQAGIPVTMLESGNSFPRGLHIRISGREIKRPSREDFAIAKYLDQAEFVNLQDCRTRWIKAHHLGGLSNFWGGAVLRFSKQDLLNGEQIHPKFRWPFSYEELAPWYEKVEKLIGIRGSVDGYETLPACCVVQKCVLDPVWQPFADLVREFGHELTVLPDVYGQKSIVSLVPSPINLAVKIIHKLRNSKIFRLVSNAHVTRIDLNKYRPEVEAVEYLDTFNGCLQKLYVKAAVLAAGPLSSTQILLNSTCSSFRDGLGNSSGVLGKYLHDNPLLEIHFRTNFMFSQLNSNDIGGLYLTRKAYHGSKPLHAFGCQIYGGIPKNQLINARKGLTLSAEKEFPEKNYISFFCFGTQVPRETSFVSLHPSAKDKYGLPLLQIHTKFLESDLDNIAEARKAILDLVTASSWQFSLLSEQLQPPGSSVHFGGTVRMHESPDYGVIDAWNRLHDVKNLLVVDASCFTTCVEKNPTLTVMAIAMRAANQLAQSQYDD